MTLTLKRMNTLKNGSDTFGREKAVRVSAELLRSVGTAFFPLDLKKLVAAFKEQIFLLEVIEL